MRIPSKSHRAFSKTGPWLYTCMKSSSPNPFSTRNNIVVDLTKTKQLSAVKKAKKDATAKRKAFNKLVKKIDKYTTKIHELEAQMTQEQLDTYLTGDRGQ